MKDAVTLGIALCLTAAAMAAPTRTQAQSRLNPAQVRLGSDMGGAQPVEDNTIFTHVLLEQAEGRWNGRNEEFRYDGQAWSGTDLNKIWLKSEGLVTNSGRFTDGQHEFLFDRAISTYFDLQAGVRVDLDQGVTRTWGAFGIQGLSLYFFDVEATAYVSDRGRFAARLKASYDLLITNRLILQPEAEINLYSKSDEGRGTGSGLSDIDAGLRLRYEITRKFAPYVGVSYAGRFFQSADFARREGEAPNDVRFVFGVRSWF
ncbi:MAG: copper resistance protein B [Alphaproteobacteria bacterium]|nr:copper resistance protein B [Alphaproteobacteria bacterium]